VTDRGPLVSIVVPLLDEAAALPGLLDHLAELHGRFEVIVADGGSTDGTIDLARAHALRPRIVAARGRARQLNTGAAAARGDALVCLHADTRLPYDAYTSLCHALREFDLVGGNFALRFGGGDSFSRSAPGTRCSGVSASTTATPRSGRGAAPLRRWVATASWRSWTTTTSCVGSSAMVGRPACQAPP
jgi:glycosyltransferase involved in cell wall biosynthesis